MTQYNYYVMHNHTKNSGVKFVIDNIFRALQKFSDFNLNLLYSESYAKYEFPGVVAHNLEELAYDDKIFGSKGELDAYAMQVKEKIKDRMDFSNPCVLHIHNLNLIKNSYLGRAIQFLADEFEVGKDTEEEKKLLVIAQVHDFAEDNRPERLEVMQNVTGSLDVEFANQVGYPTGPNIIYCAINNRDRNLLLDIGLENVFLFANNIDCDALEQKPEVGGLKERLAEYAEANGYNFDANRRILLSPLKVMRRKNVIETIFVLNELNKRKDEWQLLITLDANSGADIAYSDLIKEYIKKNNLPVTIGFGFDFVSPTIERSEKFPFNLRDVMEIADVNITTSIQEGFGMSYIEGWVADTMVTGRRLSYIFKDFEAKGIDLSGFYDVLSVNGRDFKNYTEEEKIALMEKGDYVLDDASGFEEFLDGIMNPDNSVVENNKKIVKMEYSLEAYYRMILKMVKFGFMNNFPPVKVNNKKLIKYFEDLNGN